MSKQVHFIPESCRGKDADFEGHLVLRKPTVADLFEGTAIAKRCEGENELEATTELLKWSSKFYMEVAIKNLGDDSLYKSFDDLMQDAETFIVLQEVALALVTGVSKKKKKLKAA
jgi:hypothetical protein